MERVTARSMATVSLVAMVLAMLVSFPGRAVAGELVTTFGTGKTYQTYYKAACQWYDYRIGTGAPCYEAVWSSTTAQGAYPSDVMRVWSKAGYHHFTCSQGWCPYYYQLFGGDPLDISVVYHVSDYLAHEHVPGPGENPKNVVGYAWHMNVTRAPSGWWYTESYVYY